MCFASSSSYYYCQPRFVFIGLGTIGLFVSIVLVAQQLNEAQQDRYFVDEVWTTSSCSKYPNPPVGHPCYVIGAAGCDEDLDILDALLPREYRGITYYVQTEEVSTWEDEIDRLLGCDTLGFDKLIATHGQPKILLLDNYVNSKWAHYSSGLACNSDDKRIVFPNKRRILGHTGVLIHEFAHYFQDILTDNWVLPCGDALFETIVPDEYGNSAWGDGVSWPYCYGLDNGTAGVPNSIELMAIVTEGACTPNEHSLHRVCGPSWDFLSDDSNPHAVLLKECVLELYS